MSVVSFLCRRKNKSSAFNDEGGFFRCTEKGAYAAEFSNRISDCSAAFAVLDGQLGSAGVLRKVSFTAVHRKEHIGICCAGDCVAAKVNRQILINNALASRGDVAVKINSVGLCFVRTVDSVG